MPVPSPLAWSAQEIDSYLARFGLDLPAPQRARLVEIATAASQLGRNLARMPSKFDEPANAYRVPFQSE